MTRKNDMLLDALKTVKHKINWEQFDYCFRHYSDWGCVKDEEFHRLRLGYLSGEIRGVELDTYIQLKITALEKLKG